MDLGGKSSVLVDTIKYKLFEIIADNAEIDETIKNKWSWFWLEEKDLNCYKDCLSDYIVKIKKPGFAYCFYCNVPVFYGSSGNRNLGKYTTR